MNCKHIKHFDTIVRNFGSLLHDPKHKCIPNGITITIDENSFIDTCINTYLNNETAIIIAQRTQATDDQIRIFRSLLLIGLPSTTALINIAAKFIIHLIDAGCSINLARSINESDIHTLDGRLNLQFRGITRNGSFNDRSLRDIYLPRPADIIREQLRGLVQQMGGSIIANNNLPGIWISNNYDMAFIAGRHFIDIANIGYFKSSSSDPLSCSVINRASLSVFFGIPEIMLPLLAAFSSDAHTTMAGIDGPLNIAIYIWRTIKGHIIESLDCSNYTTVKHWLNSSTISNTIRSICGEATSSSDLLDAENAFCNTVLYYNGGEITEGVTPSSPTGLTSCKASTILHETVPLAKSDLCSGRIILPLLTALGSNITLHHTCPFIKAGEWHENATNISQINYKFDLTDPTGTKLINAICDYTFDTLGHSCCSAFIIAPSTWISERIQSAFRIGATAVAYVAIAAAQHDSSVGALQQSISVVAIDALLLTLWVQTH